jgi:tetratricopeptide (TPR) repeat protein
MTQVTLEQAIQLARQHQQAGQLGHAESIYRQILAQNANHLDALVGLGLLAMQVGHPESIQLLDRAAVLRPSDPTLVNILGRALEAQGHREQAVACFARAAQIQPNAPEPLYNLGNVLRDLGRTEEALDCFARAVALRSDFSEALTNLANLLQGRGQYDEAIALYHRAIAAKPLDFGAHTNLGNALQNSGRFEEALAVHRHAVALRPDVPEVHANLAAALLDQGYIDGAVDSYRQSIALRSDFADAHNTLSLILLLRGDFEEGWREHEWRWRVPGFPSPIRTPPGRRWNGSAPADADHARLLLMSEQGFGDVIHFIRYIPLAIRRGWRVILECPPELLRLMEESDGLGATLVRRDDAWAIPAVDYDAHLPLMSLPVVLGELDPRRPTIAAAPYLRANPELRRAWRDRLETDGPGFRVGIAWAGSAVHKNDRKRSMPLSVLAPLARDGVRLYSIQLGQPAGQLQNMPHGMNVIDLTGNIRDFADTAALLSELDLLISVDTAPLHVAGALGRPAWIMLPFIPDFRWMLGRDDSPLYPSLRLFRQTRPGDWAGVVARVADALAARIATPEPQGAAATP